MLALATLDKPNMLILDEPTNHLDIDARNELLNALNDFDGAVILVSHDRRLIEATADRLFLVADGKVEPFDGDLDDYRRFLLTGDNAPTRRDEPAPKITKEEARRDAAEKRKALRPLKEKVELAEAPDRGTEQGDREIRQGARRSADLHAGPRQGHRGIEEARRSAAQARSRGNALARRERGIRSRDGRRLAFQRRLRDRAPFLLCAAIAARSRHRDFSQPA